MRRPDYGQRTGVDLLGLTRRVAKLERQNRFWRFGGLLAVAALAFSLTAEVRAQQGRKEAPLRAESVEAQHFVLIDQNGKTLGELVVSPRGGSLNLYGPDGKVIFSTTPRFFAAQR